MGTNRRGIKVKTPGYGAWADMLQRCKNTKLSNYNLYGGRGIKVCERWKSFDNFFEDMGLKPQGYTLGRIDNDGDYEPGNCRWETLKQQARNTRQCRFITWRNETKTIAEWADGALCNKVTFRTRLHRGWPIAEALGLNALERGQHR